MSEVLTLVSKDYGYVLLAATAIQIQCVLTGGAIVAQRRKHGVNYPDMGTGRHAAKLSDAAWTEFNNHQRVHYNYVENIASVTFLLCTGGLFYPRASAALGAVYIAGRFIFARGYTKAGPDGRMLGTAILHIGDFGLLAVTVYGILHKMLGLF
ncbi:hypothetical protein SeMB42_g02062 [Synchytrium endobioticum]|uniref:Glutathione transferase n=1 Tax=Synchytrium endobioticum TaxID=286115 RepID=A0A507DAU8_9FUNG|nr:hypothetical protein SeLEV6574_g01900 [Synchytrium endobioticum]TPX50933.1 hypothetical protein SeMB42_g02062 [Synchytrium endobioticum]